MIHVKGSYNGFTDGSNNAETKATYPWEGEFMYRVEWLNDNGDTCVKSGFETSEEAHEWIKKHHFKKFDFPMVFYDGD